MTEPRYLRVLVCGGRDFMDAHLLVRTLDDLHTKYYVRTVIEGDAPGADRLAGNWAIGRDISNLKFPADWKTHGRAAGPIRNKRMLDEGYPDLVVAFPGGRGTANMIEQAERAGVPVMRAGNGEEKTR